MPSLGDISQFLTAIAAVGACLLSWRNSLKIEQVHKATNSLTDRLVETTRSDANQTGVTEGRRLEKAGE